MKKGTTNNPNGRPKGAKNKHSFNVEEIAKQYPMEPFEFFMAVINKDFKKLGYDSPTKISYSPAGIEFEEEYIPAEMRVKAATAASKYLYSAKQAIEVSGGEKAIEIIVKDYTKGEK